MSFSASDSSFPSPSAAPAESPPYALADFFCAPLDQEAAA